LDYLFYLLRELSAKIHPELDAVFQKIEKLGNFVVFLHNRYFAVIAVSEIYPKLFLRTIRPMKTQGFSKQERICRRNDFNLLFSEGKSFFSYPFRCIFLQKASDEFAARIAISVSKKKFKRAVDRNRIKRLMREAYRLEKHTLYDRTQEQTASLDMLIIYTENKLLEYKPIRDGMRVLLKKMLLSDKKITL